MKDIAKLLYPGMHCPFESWALFHGNCLEVLEALETESVQCIVTSPPYWGLRDYGCAKQLGLEPTPEEYAKKLVDVFRECRRVLKNDGTFWLNLGDCYAGGGRGGIGKASTLQGSHCSQNESRKARLSKKSALSGLKTKDLVGIPWLVAFALRSDGWWLRSEIIWHKPNPMPISVTDRPTPCHEQIFLLSKSMTYFYDYKAISEDMKPESALRYKSAFGGPKNEALIAANKLGVGCRIKPSGMRVSSGKRNKRSVWTITTKRFNGAHFATYPPDLIRPCILAGSRPGDIVLDPFNGAGTTGVVAMEAHRRYIGIDTNAEYLALTEKRFSEAGL